MKSPYQEDFEEEKFDQSTKIESTYNSRPQKEGYDQQLSSDRDSDNEVTIERLDSLEDEEETIKEAFETYDPFTPYSELEAWKAGVTKKL